MVFDSTWIDLAPRMNNNPPTNGDHETDTYPNADWWGSAMQYICIDRHKGGINMAFVDMDVRHVDIKELWQLKWHMEWIKCHPPGGWPTWTDKYKDYPL
jgi:prepilin-type processing-associated H-X9-DG protein